MPWRLPSQDPAKYVWRTYAAEAVMRFRLPTPLHFRPKSNGKPRMLQLFYFSALITRCRTLRVLRVAVMRFCLVLS